MSETVTSANTAARTAGANRRTLFRLTLATVAMFGFGFALVPLYDVLCDITGLGGRTNETAAVAADLKGGVDESRTVTIEFVTSVNDSAPWRFKPTVSRMEVHPGQFYQTSFVAENLSELTLSGQGVPSVAPGENARHLQKIECFCFNRQDFGPFESKDMPVVFRIDPKLPKQVETLTLSYTFYRLDTSS